MIPLVAFGWTEFASGAVVALLSMGIWKRIETDPVDDLTERVRHPIRWKLTHPIKAIRKSW